MRNSFPLSILLLCSLASIGIAEDKPPELPVISVTKKHASYVTAVACSIDGKLAISSDMKGNVLLWEVGTELKKKGEFRATSGPGVEKWVKSVALSSDGKHLAAGSDDKTVWLWDTESGKLIRRIRGHEESVNNVFFLPDGKQGVSIDRFGNCLVWDVKGEAEPKSLKTDSREVTALSPDGKSLCYSDGNNTVLVALADGKRLSKLGTYSLSVAFTPDGKNIVKGNGSSPSTIQLWDLKTDEQIWSSKGHGNTIKRVLVTPDGKRVLSMDGVRLHIWDSKNGEEIGRYQIGGKSNATCITCTPDGKRVIIGDREGGLILHQMPKGDLP